MFFFLFVCFVCLFYFARVGLILGVLIQRHLPLHRLLGKEFEESLNSLVCQRKRLWQMMLAGETAWKWRAAPSWLPACVIIQCVNKNTGKLVKCSCS